MIDYIIFLQNPFLFVAKQTWFLITSASYSSCGLLWLYIQTDV